MRVPRSVQKAVHEGRKKVKYCSPVRAILANESLHRIAARLRILLNLKGCGWAARGARER